MICLLQNVAEAKDRVRVGLVHFKPERLSAEAKTNAITQDSAANATGTATWFRALTSGGATVFDGSVGTSGANLNLNSVAIQAGATVSVTALTYTQPQGAS